MRIDAAIVADMRAVIGPLDTDATRGAYRSGDFPRADAVKDLDKRYRWDLLYASRFDVCGRIYPTGANDTHIDTALRAIVPPLR